MSETPQQKPSVGRVIHYTPQGGGCLLPAIITRVWSLDCVDLEVFGLADHDKEKRPSSVLRAGIPQLVGGRCWDWPAYVPPIKSAAPAAAKSVSKPDVEQLAREAFDAYNREGPNPGKTWDGKDVPPFGQTGPQVQGKWRAAVSRVVELVTGAAMLVLALALLAPAAAFAQDVPPAGGSSIGAALIQALLAPQAIGVWLPLVTSGLLFLLVQWRGDKARRYEEIFYSVVTGAYHGANEYAAMHPGELISKVTYALGLMRTRLQQELGRQPTPEEIEKAKFQWSAMHGEEKTAQVMGTNPLPPGRVTPEVGRVLSTLTPAEALIRLTAGS